MRPLRLPSIAFLLLAALGPGLPAQEQDEAPRPPAVPKDAAAFAGHWSKGEAEITSYRLEQARYGELHPGTAALIFATEDFSRSRQVRIERPGAGGAPEADRTRVLKLIAEKTFATGIYPHSVMTSAFTPLDGSGSIKLAASVQEWNGQIYSQLNRRADGLEVQVRSYFEFDGDQNVKLAELELEDDVWTRIRINPDSLGQGVLEILPSLVYLRLSHRPLKAYPAIGKLEPAGADGIAAYSLEYPDFQRTLKIRFRAAFPHEIEGWEESYPEGRSGKVLTTRAVRKERLMSDYWNRNTLADAPLRKKLGLP